MGRRSRTRTKAEAAPEPPQTRKAAARATPKAPRAGAQGASETRRAMGIYAGLAVVLAILVLIGIALLGGRLGPYIVMAYAGIGAGLIHWWANRRVAGLTFTDDDRVLQAVAGGLLVMAVGFSVVSAIVDAVA